MWGWREATKEKDDLECLRRAGSFRKDTPNGFRNGWPTRVFQSGFSREKETMESVCVCARTRVHMRSCVFLCVHTVDP